MVVGPEALVAGRQVASVGAEPEAEVRAVASVAVPEEPGVLAVAEPSPRTSVSAVEPRVVWAATVSDHDIAVPQVFVDTPSAFPVSRPAFVVADEAGNSERPRPVFSPNVGFCAMSASFAEVVVGQSVHSAKGARTKCGLYSGPSIVGPHHNRNLEHGCNEPSRDRSTANDTIGLAMASTTSRSRRTSLYRYRVRRKRNRYQATVSQPEALQMPRGEAVRC